MNKTVTDLMSEGGQLGILKIRAVTMPNGNVLQECEECGRCMDKFLLVVEGKGICRECLIKGVAREATSKFLREALREILNDRGLL